MFWKTTIKNDMDKIIAHMDDKFRNLDRRLDELESQISALKTNVSNLNDKLKKEDIPKSTWGSLFDEITSTLTECMY